MSLTLANCREKLQPWILANIDKERARWIWDDQFTDILNAVARDFNLEATIRIERYYRDTVSGTTNYELQRDAIKVLQFKYHSSAYRDQYYTIVQVAGTPFVSKVVLKTAPSGTFKMDIHYLGQVKDVAGATDEIDLPDSVLYDFLELVKAKIREDYGDAPLNYYQATLETLSRKAQAKIERHPISQGVMSSWLELDSSDDHYYDITDNWLGTENVYLSGSTYVWY